MDNGFTPQSLVPYLDQTHHPFVLKLAFPKQPKIDSENLQTPFVILYDSDPLTQVFMGKVVTDTGKPFKDIFLLTQRGNYSPSVPALHGLTNRAVDRLWQEAFRLHKRGPGGISITLSANVKDDRTLLPFKSLFYCAFKDRFFHPLCPTCGRSLDLCRVDGILEARGLSPYSSSLDRYLYCPSCAEAEKLSDFYVPRKREGDPPFLLDLHDLIGAFGQIEDDMTRSFPCVPCAEKTYCYGAHGKALQRIFPFSFLPFYLLAFEAYPAHAMDFLRLVSGGSSEGNSSVPPKEEGSVSAVALKEPKEGPSPERTPSSRETDVAITRILLNIRRKWQTELKKKDKPDQAPEAVLEPEKEPAPEPRLEKTMIFSPGTIDAISSSGQAARKEETPLAPPDSPAQGIHLEKTMIFSPDAADRIASPSLPGPPGSEELNEKKGGHPPHTKIDEKAEPVVPQKKAEEVPETIFMSLDDLEGKKHDK